jgi:hypothetical protein
MKLLRHCKVVLAAGAILACVGSFAQAQTVANGPYYATPSWDQTLPSSTRFIVLSNMNSQAVLDRETGLVWQRSPDTNKRNWFDALEHCLKLALGGRKGWRLPGIAELASLVDPSVAFPGPTLPAGHPFQNVQNVQLDFYWSATTDPGFAVGNGARAVLFDIGQVGTASKDLSNYAWCMRGGPGGDTH